MSTYLGYDIEREGDHVEIYKDGAFISSADNVREAQDDIREYIKEELRINAALISSPELPLKVYIITLSQKDCPSIKSTPFPGGVFAHNALDAIRLVRDGIREMAGWPGQWSKTQVEQPIIVTKIVTHPISEI